jgi:hypothetical protein
VVEMGRLEIQKIGEREIDEEKIIIKKELFYNILIKYIIK